MNDPVQTPFGLGYSQMIDELLSYIAKAVNPYQEGSVDAIQWAAGASMAASDWQWWGK